MSTPQEIYTSFVEAMNARDWEKVQSFLADSLTVNGIDTNSKTLVSQLQGLSAIGPDIKSSVDFITPDSAGGKAFSRVIHRMTLAQDAMGATATGKAAEFAEQSIFWSQDGKVNRIYTISDFDDLRKGNEKVATAAEVVAKPGPSGSDILATFKSYVDTLNKKTTAEDFPKYFHDHVSFNNIDIELEKFREIIDSSSEFIEGLKFTLAETVVNEEKQQIGARILYAGKPVKEFKGVEPTGKSVEFSEHCFYQFDDGKIKQMVTLLDMEVFRQIISG